MKTKGKSITNHSMLQTETDFYSLGFSPYTYHTFRNYVCQRDI